MQIDTGFNGWLTLPQTVVEDIGLPIIGQVESFLAGQEEPEETDVASAQISWLGEVRRVDVIVLNDYLIGTALLEDTRLTIDYKTGEVAVVAGEVADLPEKQNSSLIHSLVCAGIAEQIYENKRVRALPELTLDIGKGITPDLSIYERDTIKPNFRRDVTRFGAMPILAIEVISSSQNIQDLLIKAEMLVEHGVKAVWTIEPFTNTIFVTTPDGKEKFSSQVIESEGISVDFTKIFD